MPLRAIARLIQTILYAKRFFPYYVYNILGGIEEDGPYRFVIRTLNRLIVLFRPSQALARYTPLTPSDRMKERHVVRQVLRRL